MYRRVSLALVILMPLALSGCPGVVPVVDSTVNDELRAALAAQGVTAIAEPTTHPDKVLLGQMLMYDKVLSGNRDISCSTCHHPSVGTSDGLSLSKGAGGVGLAQARFGPFDDEGRPLLIPRNAPDVFNRAGFKVLFWDGRVAQNADGSFSTPAGDQLPSGLDNALAAQALFPLTSAAEMRGQPGENEIADLPADDLQGIWSALMARLMVIEEYRRLFAAAYPGVAEEALTIAHAVNAMAEFEAQHWTLDDSPFDQYLRGDDSALSDAAKRGALLFYGRAGCSQCHSGPLLTDERFHSVGVPQLGPGQGVGEDGTSDFGREHVTGDPGDRYRFRTPPLRNVADSGPWMHDGAYTTLAAAVRHMLDPAAAAETYDAAQLPGELEPMVRMAQTQAILDNMDANEIRTVTLTDVEFDDLMAFLNALTSPSLASLPARDIPERVPSGLPLAD